MGRVLLGSVRVRAVARGVWLLAAVWIIIS